MNSSDQLKKGNILNQLLQIYGFDVSTIEKIITGSKYVAVELKNGNIGLAANLYGLKSITANDIKRISFGSKRFRTLFTAYINASINYSHSHIVKHDFFNCIDFKNYKDIVMIGYSEPLVSKFSRININLSIFDLEKQDNQIKRQSQLKVYLKKCDCLIITGTSLINNTFKKVISKIGDECDVFMIGPSCPLDKHVLFEYHVKAIFGMLFRKNDLELLDMIKNDSGTDKFKKIGIKAALFRN
jgi:uncharacterized protein (DUF4213/DUF364 family)